MINVKKESINKVCSFYASDWHLITMLLPHINKVIDDGAKITTILETSAQDKVETLLGKLRLENADKILNIGWNNKDINEEEIKKILLYTKSKKIEIIISGKKSYIESINKIIEQLLEKYEIKNEVKIINCYPIEEQFDIKEILEKHNYVLNTAGERTTEEFENSINIVK